MQMWFTGEYREVVDNQRLVYTEAMSDEHGTVLSPADIGMPDSHPTTTEIHVEFAAVNGGTKMVMTHLGIPAGSPGDAGWAMAFAKLGRSEEHTSELQYLMRIQYAVLCLKKNTQQVTQKV